MNSFLSTLFLLALIPGTALAWGKKGHAAVAELAAANLSPPAQAQVRELLKNDLDAYERPSGRTSLTEIASWADEIRETAPKGFYKGWHTRGNPVCSSRPGSCRDGACVDQKIIEYTAILKDRKQPLRARNEALKWVVHLIGDLHMPLHSGSNGDSAGQKITVELLGQKTSRNPTLHTVWDRELAVMALNQGPLSGQLQANQASLDTREINRWMQESRAVAYSHAYAPLPGFACNQFSPDTVVLDQAYQKQALPVIRSQMTRAGLRLAQWLNQTLQ